MLLRKKEKVPRESERECVYMGGKKGRNRNRINGKKGKKRIKELRVEKRKKEEVR